MKIKVYYEDKRHPIELDVPDAQCEIWVEDDYRRRLSAAEDKSAVTRRTAQEIMDEDYNKPTFNNNQTETRRHVSLDALNADGNLIGHTDDVGITEPDRYEELQKAIGRLKPRQRELIKKVFWEDIRQVEIAKAEGVSESAIAQRMAAIYARLKKFLTEDK